MAGRQLKSFDEFLEKKFPESRRKGVLPDGDPRTAAPADPSRSQDRWVDESGRVGQGRTSGRTEVDCATWLHRAKELPKEAFRQEVDRHLTGQETEPWEIIYFQGLQSQIPVIEQALETAGLMLGTNKSRGYGWK